MFEELKKRGTLRGIEEEKKAEEMRPREPLSPQEIIAEAHKKMAAKKDVPSAHDLMKKKQRKDGGN